MVAAYKLDGIGVRAKKETLRELVYGYFLKRSVSWARRHWRSLLWSLPVFLRVNPFDPGDFAEKRVLKLVEWFSGHCRAIKS